MLLALGLFAAALIGQAGPSAKAPESGLIRYETRVIDAGLEWREKVGVSLQPIARCGRNQIWTTDGDGLCRLLEHLQSQPKGNLVQAPTSVGESGAPLQVEHATNRHYVAAVEQASGGAKGFPPGFKPVMDSIRDGLHCTMSGRKLDQGMLVRLDIEDTQFLAFHTVRQAPVMNAAGQEVRASYQVPEVAETKVAGEWLIPDGGFLVISLGARSVPDGKNEGNVRERLLVLHACPMPDNLTSTPLPRIATPPDRDAHQTSHPGAVPARVEPFPSSSYPHIISSVDASPTGRLVAGATTPTSGMTPPPLPPPGMAPPPLAPPGDELGPQGKGRVLSFSITQSGPLILMPAQVLPTPAPPSRSLPGANAADDPNAELPPLPDDDAQAAALDPSAEPRPSPQARPIPGHRDEMAVRDHVNSGGASFVRFIPISPAPESAKGDGCCDGETCCASLEKNARRERNQGLIDGPLGKLLAESLLNGVSQYLTGDEPKARSTPSRPEAELVTIQMPMPGGKTVAIPVVSNAESPVAVRIPLGDSAVMEIKATVSIKPADSKSKK